MNTYWNWADVHVADTYATEMESWRNQSTAECVPTESRPLRFSSLISTLQSGRVAQGRFRVARIAGGVAVVFVRAREVESCQSTSLTSHGSTQSHVEYVVESHWNERLFDSRCAQDGWSGSSRAQRVVAQPCRRRGRSTPSECAGSRSRACAGQLSQE